MRAPDFWWSEPGLCARLLQPAAAIYGAVAASRMERAGASAGVPVICIGNLTLGGTGKTPTAIAVGRILRELGRMPAFLTRGYGGTLHGPVLVDPARHGFGEVGDEALLLARHGQTVVSRDRRAGAALAVAAGADVIVMDDGLQNPSLRKDLVLAVFDGAVGMGNGLVFPAGPLRAPPGAQWPHIGAALVIGSGERGWDVVEAAEAYAVPVLSAEFRADPERAAALRGRPVLAFAGIGRPGKFFTTLREIGAEIAEARAFPDHHPYTERDLFDLLALAERTGAAPVTTEKDLVRLIGFAAAEPRVASIVALPVSLRFAEEDRLRALLRDALARR